MTTPDTAKPFADVLAENGRPVDPEGMRRAGERLATRDRERGDRADVLARIREAAPAA